MPIKNGGKANTSPNTMNWDTVYAIRFTDVNKAIAASQGGYIPFNMSWIDEDESNREYNVLGDLKPWYLEGGDDSLLHIRLPFDSCSLIVKSKKSGLFTDLPAKSATYDPNKPAATYDSKKPASSTNYNNISANIEVKIELNLLWVEDPTNAKNHYNLESDTTVSVLDVYTKTKDGVETRLKSIRGGHIREAVQSWLLQNPDLFKKVFASLDMNAKVDKSKGLEWLLPTDKSYGVIGVNERKDVKDANGKVSKKKLPNLDKSVFGVLCMTENRPSPDNHQISAFAIPEGSNSGFLIAPERMVENMIKPGLLALFSGATLADFVNYADNQKILTNNRDLDIPKQLLEVKNDKGEVTSSKEVTPRVEKNKFTIELDGNLVKMQFLEMSFEYSPGITVHITHTSHGQLSIAQLNGKASFVLNIVGSPSTTVSVTTSTAFDVLSIVGSVVLSIAGSIIGGAVAGKIVAVGAKAATQAVTIGARAGVTAATNVTAEAIGGAAVEAAAAISGKAPSVLGRIGGFFARNWPKLLGGVIGAGVGATVGEIPNMIKAAANNADDMSSLDSICTQALEPIAWPNMETEGYILNGGELNDAFRMGFTLKYKK